MNKMNITINTSYAISDENAFEFITEVITIVVIIIIIVIIIIVIIIIMIAVIVDTVFKLSLCRNFCTFARVFPIIYSFFTCEPQHIHVITIIIIITIIVVIIIITTVINILDSNMTDIVPFDFRIFLLSKKSLVCDYKRVAFTHCHILWRN